MTSILSLLEVSKRYGPVRAVEGVDLEVRDGEILTLVGPSGCGKSTLLRLVAGLAAPDAGEIRIRDELVSGGGVWAPPERRRIGIVFQDHALFPHLSVAENVGFGLGRRERRGGRVGEVLRMVGMEDHAERYPHELSGGEQQRVALARALAPAPAVILLDEPFSDLDRNLRERVRRETMDVLREAGATAIFVTHDREEALVVGDRVAVMRAGRIEQTGVPSAVFHAPRSRFVATFMGEADFLPARRENGRMRTEAGYAPPPPGTEEGDETEIMVRPHEVAFDLDRGTKATIVGREFQGAFVLYTLELSSGRRLRSLQSHTRVFRPGTAIGIRLDHGHPPATFRGDEAVAGPDGG